MNLQIRELRQNFKTSFSSANLNQLKNFILKKVGKECKFVDSVKLLIEELVDYASTEIQRNMIFDFILEVLFTKNDSHGYFHSLMIEVLEDSFIEFLKEFLPLLPDISLQHFWDALYSSKQTFVKLSLLRPFLAKFFLAHLASHNSFLDNENGNRFIQLFGREELRMQLLNQSKKFLNASIMFIAHGLYTFNS